MISTSVILFHQTAATENCITLCMKRTIMEKFKNAIEILSYLHYTFRCCLLTKGFFVLDCYKTITTITTSCTIDEKID